MTGKINKTEFDGYNQHAKFDFLLKWANIMQVHYSL